jgi:hypothetical protein
MKKEYDFARAVRGPVLRLPAGKTRITIRIDDEVLRWFRAQVHAARGGSYQSLMNAALREHIGRHEERLEDTLRVVIREELGRYEVRRPPVAPARSNKRMPLTRSAKARRRGPRS